MPWENEEVLCVLVLGFHSCSWTAGANEVLSDSKNGIEGAEAEARKV